MGLPGSGKSYFAKHLSGKLKCVYISSDETRKKMKAMGKYRLEDKLAVYREMRSLAKNAIEQGKQVVLDATFYKENIRNEFISLALVKNIPYSLIWIEASLEIIKERLAKKREDSEADFEIYLKLAQQFENPELPYLKLESKRNNIEEMVCKAEEYIQKRI